MNTFNLHESVVCRTHSVCAAAVIALLVGMMPMPATGAADAAARAPVLLNAAATATGVAEKPGLAATSAPQISPNGARNTINWMGHWYKADKRYDLVLEMKRDFSFRNQDTSINLQFPEQIVGTNDKVVVARLITEMIKNKKIDWDIVWMDNHIYQFVAEELNDPFWGRKHLVNFEEVPGFVQSQKPFIIEDPSYRNQTGGILVGPYIGNCQPSCRLSTCDYAAILSSKSPSIFRSFSAIC